LTYLEARKGDVVDDYFGTRVADPYRWMEDLNSAELKQWVDAENAITGKYLDTLPMRDALRKRITELWNYPKVTPPRYEGRHWFYNRNSGLQRQSVVFTRETLNGAESVAIDPNSLLLTLDWQVASPMLYTREIEQRRRDIRVVDINLLRRSWYFEYLRRAYPELIERSRDKIDVYVADLKEWENDPEAYRKSAALTRKIATAFQEMLQSIVTKEMAVAPVYATAEVMLFTDPRDDNLVAWLKASFQAVPRGLVFQLTRDTDFHDPGEPRLQTRGLVDGTIRFAEDDAVKLKVVPVYKAMMLSRGQYLTTFNQQERAAAAFEEARRFGPDPTLESKN